MLCCVKCHVIVCMWLLDRGTDARWGRSAQREGFLITRSSAHMHTVVVRIWKLESGICGAMSYSIWKLESGICGAMSYSKQYHNYSTVRVMSGVNE